MHSSALGRGPRLSPKPRPKPRHTNNPQIISHLQNGGMTITVTSTFGAASASILHNKEAANSSNMTYTLFDSPRHYPNRSGCRNGVLYRLS